MSAKKTPAQVLRTMKRKSVKNAVTKTSAAKLDLFVRSLQEHYPNDPSCPGIVFSYLPGLRMFYGSVVRYKSQYGANSYSLFNTKAETLQEVFAELQNMWLNRIAPSKDATAELLKIR
jgi:hypothetical protein